MKKIKMVVELEYDDDLIHGEDSEAIHWFYNDVLSVKEDALFLYSDEIGDDVGKVKVVEILDSPKDKKEELDNLNHRLDTLYDSIIKLLMPYGKTNVVDELKSIHQQLSTGAGPVGGPPYYQQFIDVLMNEATLRKGENDDAIS